MYSSDFLCFTVHISYVYSSDFFYRGMIGYFHISFVKTSGKRLLIHLTFIFLWVNWKIGSTILYSIFQKMPTACKPLLLEFLKEDIAWWAKYLEIDPRILRKLVNGTGAIRIETARAIIERIDELTGEKNDIERFFVLSELKGQEKKRKVVYEESADLFTKEDWISIVRYVIEKRFDAFSVLDVLIFLLFVGILGVVLSYFFL